MNESQRRASRARWCAALLAVWLTPAGLAAQAHEGVPSRVLTGVVVDELTRGPVAGAVVRIAGHLPATITDPDGHFTLSGFGPGVQELQVQQFGYQDITTDVVPPELSDVLVEIPLAPEPVTLEGITAVVDHLATMTQRIESRQRAAGVSVRTFDQERLVRSGSPSVLEFLLRQPAVNPQACTNRGLAELCFVRRGRLVRPRVYIDELPAFGGLDELATVRPDDLYRIEIYSAGLEVRAYTFRFMERMSRRPMALLPIGVGR